MDLQKKDAKALQDRAWELWERLCERSQELWSLSWTEDSIKAHFEDVVARYAEVHRHYHTLPHVLGLLESLRLILPPGNDVLEREQAIHHNTGSETWLVTPVSLLVDGAETKPSLSLSPRAQLVWCWAAWFHDVIYEALASDNEARSAAFAAELLGRWALPSVEIEQVVSIIEATAKHQPQSGDMVEALFLDADLSVLTLPRPAYIVYTVAVREEYAIVPDREFWLGRRAVLKRFLDREQLFFTPWMQDVGTPLAKENLHWEIAWLSKSLKALE